MTGARLRSLLATFAIATIATSSFAQQTPPTPPPPAPTTPPAPTPSEPTKQQPAPTTPPSGGQGGELPSIDDLLGTGDKEARPKGDGNAAADASKAELQRQLDAKEMGDAFRQAVTLMGEAADRLAGAKDAGADTQRLQDSVVQKLDQLISQMEKQQSSSGRSRSRQQQDPGDRSNSQRQQARAQQNQNRQGDNNAEIDPPAPQTGELRPELESARAAWGALPERIRNALMQGSQDRFSSMYEKLTQTYYRRLAEEANKK